MSDAEQIAKGTAGAMKVGIATAMCPPLGAAVALFEIAKAAARSIGGEEAEEGVGLVEKAWGDFSDTDCTTSSHD
ncbi:MAG TPA: hypothetical protein DDZ88_25095 [Verrucomicrobiales bacterium]|nr:hypothetical protein [Verrucomicrobiales bacterium]